MWGSRVGEDFKDGGLVVKLEGKLLEWIIFVFRV